MKKILALVLVMAVSVMAGTVSFSGVDNGDGTVTITADAPVVGLALDVDADMDVTAVAVDSFFDVFMDYAYDQGASYVYGEGSAIAAQDAAGVATLPSMAFCISAGGLEDDAADTVPATSEIVLTVDGSGDIVISENTLRGGVVDYDGAMTTNLPITINIPDEPTACYGDVDGNAFVNAGDITALVNYINANGAAPFWSVAVDATNGGYDVDSNNFINAGDITALVNYINANGAAPFWSIACP